MFFESIKMSWQPFLITEAAIKKDIDDLKAAVEDHNPQVVNV